MIRLTLFDLDGTLVDSREDLAQAVNHALATVGLPPRSRDEVASFVGEGARLLVARSVAPRTDLLEPALAAWWSHYEQHLLDHTVLFPGIAAVLARARTTLAVHTNKPGTMARRILDGLGVGGRFAAVTGGDEAPRKPDPAGARALMARLGARPEETVLIGDSRIDLETAAAAGIRSVAVSWGLVSPEVLRQAGASLIVDRAEELLPWVGA